MRRRRTINDTMRQGNQHSIRIPANKKQKVKKVANDVYTACALQENTVTRLTWFLLGTTRIIQGALTAKKLPTTPRRMPQCRPHCGPRPQSSPRQTQLLLPRPTAISYGYL